MTESQDDALGKAKELGEELQDEKSIEHLETVMTAMENAIENLDATVEGRETSHLKTALRFEQAASEGLLKLRAREHEIVRSQQQRRSSSSSASRQNRQRQIEQLELKDDNDDTRHSERRPPKRKPLTVKCDR